MPTLDAPVDWQELVRLTMRHGTGPLVFDRALRLTGPYAPDAALRMQMKQMCVRNMLLQEEWVPIRDKVFTTLEGLDPVLLKGFSYAALYPVPYLRAWGDLDVWIGVEHYHEACGRLREAFPEAKHHDEEWDELKHYCFVMDDGKAIELHRVSMEFASRRDWKYYHRLEMNAMQHGQIDPTFGLLFCFLHAWEHFCGTGMPHKQVCDLALLAHTSSVDQEALSRHLKVLRLLEVWQSVGYVVCKTTGLPASEWPLYSETKTIRRHGEQLYQRILHEGQCRVKQLAEGAKDRYEARDMARRMPVWRRKLLTLRGRWEEYRFLARFAPRYARHLFLATFIKGIRRTLRHEEMINY